MYIEALCVGENQLGSASDVWEESKQINNLANLSLSYNKKSCCRRAE
jgi:hypothetical protein